MYSLLFLLCNTTSILQDKYIILIGPVAIWCKMHDLCIFNGSLWIKKQGMTNGQTCLHETHFMCSPATPLWYMQYVMHNWIFLFMCCIAWFLNPIYEWETHMLKSILFITFFSFSILIYSYSYYNIDKIMLHILT